MGSSLSVRNDLPFNIHVALFQVGPVHRTYNLRPGQTHKFECGKVWFTVNAYCANEENSKLINEAAQAMSIIGFSSMFIGAVPNPFTIALGTAMGITSAGGTMALQGASPVNITQLVLAIASGFTGNISQLKSVEGLANTAGAADHFVTVANGAVTIVGCDSVVTKSLDEIIEETKGIIASDRGVYADGRTLYIRWDDANSRPYIKGGPTHP